MQPTTLIAIAAWGTFAAAAVSALVGWSAHVWQVRREQRADVSASVHRAAGRPTNLLRVAVWNEGPGVALDVQSRVLEDDLTLKAIAGQREAARVKMSEEAGRLEPGSHATGACETKSNVRNRVYLELTWGEEGQPAEWRRRLPRWLGGRDPARRRRRVLVCHVA